VGRPSWHKIAIDKVYICVKIVYVNSLKVTALIMLTIIIDLNTAWGDVGSTNLCDYLDLPTCSLGYRGRRRTSGASIPTQGGTVSNNPATVSTDKGLGVESIYYDSDAQYSLVTGTGRIGAAFVSNPADDTFFGNYAIENYYSYQARKVNKKKFKSKKIAIGGAVNITDRGEQRKPIQLNLGVSFRRSPEIGKANWGTGLSLMLNGQFSAGFGIYNDDSYIDYRGQVITFEYNGQTYTYQIPDDPDYVIVSRYKVTTWSVGYKNQYFAVDYAKIKTEFKDSDGTYVPMVKIINGTVFIKDFMLTAGYREEDSARDEYDYDTKQFIEKRNKKSKFFGAQYSIGKRFLVGGFFNYFLVNDISAALTVFF
jgi:hypothetical protein